MYSGNVIEHPSSFCIHYIYLAVVEAVCNSKSNIIVVPALYYKLNKEGRLPFVKLAARCNRVRLSDVRALGQLGPF